MTPADLAKAAPKKSLQERIEDSIVRITESGCWIWMKHLDISGYGKIRIGKMFKAHRASWMAFRGEIPAGMWVLHRCDIRCCVNPDHLFIGNCADNVHDMMRKGRARNPNGECNSNVKLTEQQVIEIRSSGLGCVAVSRKYGICPSTASAIKSKKIWKHI